MKKILSLLSVMALAAFLFVGCASTGGGNAYNAAAEHALITTAAATGTELALTPPTGNPQYALYFVGAQQALSSISSGTNQVSITTVEAALKEAGVTNVIVASAIENAISMGDALIQASAGTNQNAQFVAAQQVAGDVAAGIQQGLTLSGRATLHKK
jgi:hypothetical protein